MIGVNLYCELVALGQAIDTDVKNGDWSEPITDQYCEDHPTYDEEGYKDSCGYTEKVKKRIQIDITADLKDATCEEIF